MSVSIGEARAQVQEYQTHVISFRQDLMAARMALHELIWMLDMMGLPKDITQGMMAITKMIMLITALRQSIHLLEAASGPVGWAMLAVSLGHTAIVSYSLASDLDGMIRR